MSALRRGLEQLRDTLEHLPDMTMPIGPVVAVITKLLAASPEEPPTDPCEGDATWPADCGALFTCIEAAWAHNHECPKVKHVPAERGAEDNK